MLNKKYLNILKTINLKNTNPKQNFLNNFNSIRKISKNFSSTTSPFKLDININFSHLANNLQINSMKTRRKSSVLDKDNNDLITKFIEENLSKKIKKLKNL